MIRAALGTLIVLATEILVAACLMGLGLLVRRGFGLRRLSLDDCFLAFWMGFALLTLVLMLWNFVLPVNRVAFVATAAIGILGLIVSRAELRDGATAFDVPVWGWAGAALLALWIGNMSLSAVASWDSALYHMQGVAWARRFPVVPGLANLFGPLGFNNASFLYDALLDSGIPWIRSWHLANGALVLVLAVHAVTCGARFFGGRRSSEPADLFPLLLLPFILNAAVGGRLSSFATALPAAAILLAVTSRWYRSLVAEESDLRQRGYDLFCLTTLTAAAVSIKVTCAVFAAAGCLIMGITWIRRAPAGGLRTKALAWSVAAVMAIGLSWSARGAILSGYVLFPSRALSIPVAWRVPAEHARAEYDYVVHSSRVTTRNVAVLSGRAIGWRSWLPGWFHDALSAPYSLLIPTGLMGLGLALHLALRWRAPGNVRAATAPAWQMAAPLAVAIIAWFLLAPMPRYAAPFLWSAVALAGSQAIRLVPPRSRWTQRLAVGAWLIGLSPVVVVPLWTSSAESEEPESPLAAIARANLRIPPPGRWHQVEQPTPPLRTYATLSGLVVNVPGGRFGRCWDAPVPCTPNPAPNLRLRVPGRLEKGFVVDGAWQMLDWPEPWRPEVLPALREAWRRTDSTR